MPQKGKSKSSPTPPPPAPLSSIPHLLVLHAEQLGVVPGKQSGDVFGAGAEHMGHSAPVVGTHARVRPALQQRHKRLTTRSMTNKN
jgi:hypothetical protein